MSKKHPSDPVAASTSESQEVNTQATDPAVDDPKDAALYCVAHPSGLNLRADATLQAPVLTVLPFGACVVPTGAVISQDGTDWIPVATSTGKEGFVMLQYLSTTTNN